MCPRGVVDDLRPDGLKRRQPGEVHTFLGCSCFSVLKCPSANGRLHAQIHESANPCSKIFQKGLRCSITELADCRVFPVLKERATVTGDAIEVMEEGPLT